MFCNLKASAVFEGTGSTVGQGTPAALRCFRLLHGGERVLGHKRVYAEQADHPVPYGEQAMEAGAGGTVGAGSVVLGAQG